MSEEAWRQVLGLSELAGHRQMVVERGLGLGLRSRALMMILFKGSSRCSFFVFRKSEIAQRT